MELNGKKLTIERFLQGCAAFYWIFSIVGMSLMSLVITAYLILFHSTIRWLVLLYLTFIYFEYDICEKGGRCHEWARNFKIWQYLKDYFPVKLAKASDDIILDPKRNYLFCAFPHGLLCTAACVNFTTNSTGFKKIFPGLKSWLFTVPCHYLIPFYREYTLTLGGVSSSEKSINSILSHPGGGKVGVLMIGGAEESFYCRPGSNKIVLNKRRGFIRVALKNGCPIVPVYSFGETDLYDQVTNPEIINVQQKVKKITGITPILPIGRGIFNFSFDFSFFFLIPRRKPVTTVVGKPIEMPKIESPTKEDINHYHEIFVNSLKELFESQKHKYLKNADKAELIIV